MIISQIKLVLNELLKSATFLVFFISFHHSYGQAEGGGGAQATFPVPNISDLISIPKSPEVAAFNKYGNNSISYYTGTPDINIPLGAVSVNGNINLPVSITYDASGIKVSQIASNIGLGWNLKVGGMISRDVNGRPDDYLDSNSNTNGVFEKIYFPFYDIPEFETILNGNFHQGTEHPIGVLENTYFSHLTTAVSNSYDTQPDVYSFSINDFSGKFYIDYINDKGICIGDPSIRIDVEINEVEGIKQINSFTVYDASGTKYFFDKREITEAFEESGGSPDYRKYISSWFITSITYPKSDITLDFFYEIISPWVNRQSAHTGDIYSIVDNSLAAEVEEPGACGANSLEVSFISEYKVHQLNLNKISYNGIDLMDITYDSNERSDLDGQYAINQIDFKNIKGDDISKTTFQYDYFGTPASPLESNSRLKLLGIDMYGDQYPGEAKNYSFTYNEAIQMPSRNSMSRDYWGYYNEANNTTLVPDDGRDDFPNGSTFSGANRYSNDNAKVGVLTQVEYPTGGTTTYHYKLHDTQKLNGETSVEEISLGGISLSGGTVSESSDPFNYNDCDDATSLTPKSTSSSFTIDEARNVKLTWDQIGNPSGGTHFQYAALYKSGICIDDNCVDVWYDFCDLQSINLLWTIYDGSEYINLEPGNYRIVGLNTDPNVSLLATITYEELVSEMAEVGGLRLHKVVDDPVDGNVIEKYFYYGDLAQDSEPISMEYIDTVSAGGGFIHQRAKFRSNYSWQVLVQGDAASSGSLGSELQVSLVDCSKSNIHSSNLSKANGSHVTYPIVSELMFENGELNGFSVYEFYNDDNSSLSSFSYRPLNGKTKSKRHYDDQKNLLKEEEHKWSFEVLNSIGGYYFTSNQSLLTDKQYYQKNGLETWYNYYGNLGGICEEARAFPDTTWAMTSCNRLFMTPNYVKKKIGISQYWPKLDSIVYNDYYSNGTVSKLMLQEYDQLNYLSNITRNVVGDQIIERETIYPTSSSFPTLVSQHRIGEEVGSDVRVDDNLTFQSRLNYQTNNGLYLPSSQSFAYSGAALEERIQYLNYDEKGNPKEVVKDDLSTVILWGYDRTLPILIVTNATLAEVEAKIVSEGIGTSNYETEIQSFSDLDIVNEFVKLISELPKSSITIYTHKPGVGIKEMVDQNGFISTYEYDHFHRLKLVKDHNDKILQQNDYNYGN